ncbi:uncharacterized protein [Centruroides vittatus]|uniref:uncharacterized protein n=1 Tax=Centruroides vittatus TaxID=120091 RepID=UPI00350EFBF2
MQWILKFQVPKRSSKMEAPVVIWDNIQVPEFVMQILKLGPAFVPPPSPKETVKSCIPDLENLLRVLSHNQKKYYRWLSALRINGAKQSKDILQLKHKLSQASEWIKSNDIVVTRADKARIMVLMKQDTYERELNEYLSTTQCTEMETNWVDKTQARVKWFANTKLAKKLNMRNIITDDPDVPKLFAFAKTHKQGHELRPIMDKGRAPTIKLEKSVHNMLSTHLNDYQFNISSPKELIQKLKGIDTVWDFRSLYPSIKIEPCFCALRDFLMEKVNDDSLHQEVLQLAHLACYSSVFQFKGNAYAQERGVPMGSPLSGDLCEMVIKALEAKTLSPFLSNIILYGRYIDDIIILWKSMPDLKQFKTAMNDNPYGIQLEMEQRSPEIIHFLDIEIRIEKRIVQTGVYRKPTTIPSYIPFNSCDPYSYKIVAFRALVERANTHSSTNKALQQELAFINKIAREHSYSNIVKKLYNRHLHTSSKTNQESVVKKDAREENTERTPVTYNPHLKTIYNAIAKKKGIKIAYRRNPSIYSLLRNRKDTHNPYRLPGVYSIPLQDDRWQKQLLYIGSTKRPLCTRIKKHKSDITRHKYTTALSTYAANPEITPIFNKARVIRTTQHQEHLRTLEEIEIYKADRTTTCINFKEEMNLSTAWQFLLEERS